MNSIIRVLSAVMRRSAIRIPLYSAAPPKWKLKMIIGAAAIGVSLCTTSGAADALEYQFSFSNLNRYGVGVDGTVTGIMDLEPIGMGNTLIYEASNVYIESYPAGLINFPAAPFEITNPGVNGFTIDYVTHAITGYNFDGYGGGIYLCLSSTPMCNGAGLTDATQTYLVMSEIPAGGGPTFELLATTPLPATLSLFATGLGALGLLIRRRKRRPVKLAV